MSFGPAYTSLWGSGRLGPASISGTGVSVSVSLGGTPWPGLVIGGTLGVDYGESYRTDGIRVPLGMSRTVDVRLFSTAARSDWTVEAEDPGAFSGTPSLNFHRNKTAGNAGEILELTITRSAEGPIGGSPFIIFSYDAEYPGQSNAWAGFAAN